MVNKQKILIVDDDENIAELISLYLTKEVWSLNGLPADPERSVLLEDHNKNRVNS